MIQQFCPEDYDECYTEGCSRCSTFLSAKLDREQILEEALAGLVIVRKICNYYGIPFEQFCTDADVEISKEKSVKTTIKKASKQRSEEVEDGMGKDDVL